jgi:YidC/Oxa1 family membrane protein insertase
MEDKKLDKNSIIGFILIFGILVWIMYQNQPTEAQLKADKAKKELQLAAEKAKETPKPPTTAVITAATATAEIAKLNATLGSFANSGILSTDKNEFVTLENELLLIKVATKGGAIAEVTLKKHEKFCKNSKQLVQLISNNNADFGLEFQTKTNQIINTRDLRFTPIETKVGNNQLLIMRLETGANQYLEFKYVLKPNDHMLDFDIQSEGLSQVVNTAKPLTLQWNLKTTRNEKSISYENQYTDINFEYEDGKDNNVGQGKDQEENPEKVTYIAYKQHFFSSILLTKTPFATAKLQANNLVDDEKKDTLFTKQFRANIPLAFSNGNVDYKMNWYFGPTDYKTLKAYDRNLDKIIPLGWGIFGWINKFIFIPLFGFLSSYISYGIAIIIFTILIKLAMSPITFKSFLSSAKMKVLKPEIEELGAKFAKDPMKKQQETMKLYNKAGVNPMAGCIPALIQLPFMYASFQFFPSAFDLRQKSFLWADDLSSFDQIFKLPFNIPFYGDHVSLFPILAAIAIFFYMKMTSGDQQMQAPAQEGMPDMGQIMKII